MSWPGIYANCTSDGGDRYSRIQPDTASLRLRFDTRTEIYMKLKRREFHWDGCRWTDPIADIVCRMVNISILNIKLYGKIQKIIYGRKKYHITSKVPTNFFIALLIFSPFINISFSAFLSHITISLNHIWFGSLFHENEVIIKGIFKNITLILLRNLWILWLSQREGISRTTRWWAVLVFNCPDDNVATNSNSFIVANSFFCY